MTKNNTFSQNYAELRHLLRRYRAAIGREMPGELQQLLPTLRALRPGEAVTEMGWEYHNRERDTYGRFSGRGKRLANSAQLHMRMTPKQAKFIRAKAIANRMEISEFVWAVIQQYYNLLDEAGSIGHMTGDNRRIYHGKSLPW